MLPDLPSFPTRRSSDLGEVVLLGNRLGVGFTLGTGLGDNGLALEVLVALDVLVVLGHCHLDAGRSEEHTSELQSRFDLVCRLLLEKKMLKLHRHISMLI